MNIVVCDDVLQEGELTCSIVEHMGLTDTMVDYMSPVQLKDYIEEGKTDIQAGMQLPQSHKSRQSEWSGSWKLQTLRFPPVQ